MRAAFLLCLAVLLMCSCTKRNLNGDKEILVGEWEWVYSDLTHVSQVNQDYRVDPVSEGYTATVTFSKRNKIAFEKDGNEVYSGRIKILNFEEDQGNPNIALWGTFESNGDGVSEPYHVQILAADNDMMYLTEFPFADEGTTSVKRNVFRRK